MARAPFYLSFPRKILLLTLDPLILLGSHPFTFMWRVVFYLCHLLPRSQNLFRSRQTKWVIFVITGHFPLSAHGPSHGNSTWQVSEKAHLASSCGTGVTVLWGRNLGTHYNGSSDFHLLQDNPQHIKAMCHRQPLGSLSGLRKHSDDPSSLGPTPPEMQQWVKVSYVQWVMLNLASPTPGKPRSAGWGGGTDCCHGPWRGPPRKDQLFPVQCRQWTCCAL